MPRFQQTGAVMRVCFRVACFILMVLGVSAQAAGPSRTPTPIIPPATAAQYVHPHDRIDIDHGRKLNLFCMGKGSPTVIFDAGGSDWSVIWALVQPGVATHTRACAYDRAGMGYSDPSDEPRSPIAIVEDLNKLIHAAKITSPVVLVGHSLGGFNMKLYAALHPDEVAGLVLVDPTEDRLAARTRNAIRAKYGAAIAAELELPNAPGVTQFVSQYNDCAAAARKHDLDPHSKLYETCTDPAWQPLGPVIAAERQKIQVKRYYQDAQASEIANSVIGDPRSDAAYAMLFSGRPLGEKPLIVLGAGNDTPHSAKELASQFGLNLVHEQTAALSRRGANRIVPGAHHNIEIERPQAIVDALNEILREVPTK
jgi:pimeloyl-ACP methyl ester carboxylesterase